jgi:hypothetical protein
MQIGGGNSIQNGQVYDMSGPELGPESANAGVVTNILPSSEQVTGPSWALANGSVTNNALAAPDNTNTAATGSDQLTPTPPTQDGGCLAAGSPSC